jgi:hypothetical protein
VYGLFYGIVSSFGYIALNGKIVDRIGKDIEGTGRDLFEGTRFHYSSLLDYVAC